jgi:hypothetical protein
VTGAGELEEELLDDEPEEDDDGLEVDDVLGAAGLVVAWVVAARPGSRPATSWKKITDHAATNTAAAVAITRLRMRRIRSLRSRIAGEGEGRGELMDTPAFRWSRR